MTHVLADARPGDPLPTCRIEITQALIDAYAAISGDFNTIHVDPQAGAAAGFGGTIAHGCIPMEPLFQSVHRWCGSEVLPERTLMNFRYRAPSRPGDVIHSVAQVTQVQAEGGRRTVDLAFSCLNQRGETVIDGTCTLTA